MIATLRVNFRRFPIPISTLPYCFAQRQQLQAIRGVATEISPTMTLLRADERDNEVYLVGTSHISEQSAQEIEELIELVHPDKVFVELDPQRASQMMRDDPDPFQSRLLTAFESISQALPIPLPGGTNRNDKQSFFQSMFELLKQHGIFPGTDMKSAVLAAQRTNADIVYGDRPIDQTIQAVKNALHPSVLIKAMSTPVPPEILQVFSEVSRSNLSGLSASAEKLKSRDTARIILHWMEEVAPDVANVMVHQRDFIMAQNLRKHCGSGKVVAVVGMAHLEGIQREWLKLKPGILEQ